MKAFFSPLFAPLGLVWLLLIIGFAVLLWRRQWRSAAVLGMPAALMFLLGSTPLINWLVRAAEQPYAVADVRHLPHADAVVALGGGRLLSKHSPLGFALGEVGDRYLTGIYLTRLGKAPVLVLGGSLPVPDRPGFVQLAPIQAWIQTWSATSCAVTNLGICADTHDEALHYAKLARSQNWKRTLLVTSALHLRRAEAVFLKQGLPVVPVGCDFQVYGTETTRQVVSPFPSQRRFELWSLYLHEQIGWWVYRWRGWI